MKQSIRSFSLYIPMGFLGALLVPLHVAAFGTGTYISPRSQSVDAAFELVGWQREINMWHGGDNYWSFTIAPEYKRTFRNARMASYLLGGQTLFVAGSSYAPCTSDCGTRVLADYFGLSRDFKSTVKIQPLITDFLMDFDFYYGMDAVCKGLYLRMHMPIVYTNWNLNYCEGVATCGTASFPAGYMAATGVSHDDLPCSLELAMAGDITFGDMKEPLKYGKLRSRQTVIHTSDFQFALGYNPYLTERGHGGFNVRMAAPTGTNSCQEFLFQPVIGNGHHWELGLGLTGHYDAFMSEDAVSILSFYADLNVTHLFSNKTRRSYDLCANGTGSRYILLERLQLPSKDLFISGDVPTTYQYAGSLVNAINETTLCSTISVPVQCDFAVKAAYTWRSLTIDLGYNFWYRSKEHLDYRAAFPDNAFALKGDAQIYGFTATDEVAVALSATQHAAQLCGGQGTGNADFTNANADNAVAAFSPADSALNNLTTADATLIGIAQAPVKTSSTSIFVSDKDINECSGLAPHAVSNKLFFHMNYTWKTHHAATPYLGIGGEIEYAHGSLASNSALYQWGAWIKGGFTC